MADVELAAFRVSDVSHGTGPAKGFRGGPPRLSMIRNRRTALFTAFAAGEPLWAF